jgi:hypothetical protein
MHSKLSAIGGRDAASESQPATFKDRAEPLEVCLGNTAVSQQFDEIIVGHFTRISFHRTLRIPEDGRDYPLPAGLGRFPIHRVEDYADKVPVEWLKESGFFIPLYQREALFLQFDGPGWHPTIAKICVGKINAITGKPYSEELSKNQQDYIVMPNQKWLDGICSGEDLVKQFVAMPLGQGYTIEAQVSDEEQFGGFQIVVYDAINGRFPERDPAIDSRIKNEEEAKKQNRSEGLRTADLPAAALNPKGAAFSMGIAAGGNLKQQISRDTYGVESWSPEKKRSLTVHLVNSLAYKAITGMEPPTSPITAAAYQRANIPWYSNYDETEPVGKPPAIFKRILSIAAIDNNRGITTPDDEFKRSIAIQNIHKIKTSDKNEASNAFRERAYESRSKEWWAAAVREISYVIDLQSDVRADDYALRSCCNYHIGRFKDGSIDGSLGLIKDNSCLDALTWRAHCRKQIGEYELLYDDANELIQFPKTEIIGLELLAEAALATDRTCEAYNTAMQLKSKCPKHLRANQIISEVNIKVFGIDWEEDHDI